LLTVIDTISKFAWGEALRSKNASEVSQAMKRIFKSGRETPQNLQSGNGTEFLNSNSKVLMKSDRINLYSTLSSLKASKVVRFSQFSFNGTYKWIDMYKQLINKYSNRMNRTKQMSPSLPIKNNITNIRQSPANIFWN